MIQNNESDKFSVLIPVYCKEHAAFFREAIDSVCHQTAAPSQIVLVADGILTPELDQVIASYQAAEPEVFDVVRLDQSKGLGEALRLGVNVCKYEFIARMDSDDISVCDRFEKQLGCMLQEGLDIIGGQIEEFMYSPEQTICARRLPVEHDDILRFARRRNPFNHMTVMFKKSKVLQAGNYADIPGAEDYFLWAKMLHAGCKSKNHADCLVKARIGNGFYKRRHGFKYLKKMIWVRKQLYDMGMTHFMDLGISCFGLAVVSLMPLAIKKQVYMHVLRKKPIIRK